MLNGKGNLVKSLDFSHSPLQATKQINDFFKSITLTGTICTN